MTIIGFGLMCHSCLIFAYLRYRRPSENPTGSTLVQIVVSLLSKVGAGAVTSFLLCICLKQHIAFSCLCGYSSIIVYELFYFCLIRSLPKSFTLGEAALVSQGVTIFFVMSAVQLPTSYVRGLSSSSDLEMMKPVLQIGLLQLCVLIFLVDSFVFLRSTIAFYILVIYTLLFVMLVPSVKGEPQIYVLIDLIAANTERVFMVGAYIVLISLAVGTVLIFTRNNLQSSTRTRKIFHILIVLVFVPGLIYQCMFLFIATVLALAIFIGLETVRLVELPPFHAPLEAAVKTFIDEKDAGIVALTPIYLLVGCSTPLWIHPAPCDLTDSAGHDLLKLSAGVLSVGIGDMVASIVGSKMGRHKWPGSVKSVEGTVANICSQILVVLAFVALKLVVLDSLKWAYVGVAVILNALVEAYTTQVDNLVLPLLTYCILVLS